MNKIKELESQLSLEYEKSTVLKEVINAVAYVCSVTVDDIKGPSRLRKISDARHIFCYIVVEQRIYTYTLSEIGLFINRDHATVINSRRATDTYKQIDSDFNKLLKNCQAMLPALFKKLDPLEKAAALRIKTNQVEALNTWLVDNPSNPYRLKIQKDVRDLEQELKQINLQP